MLDRIRKNYRWISYAALIILNFWFILEFVPLPDKVKNTLQLILYFLSTFFGG